MMAYVDMFSGISGDMALGAFIDLGVPSDWLEQELSCLLKGFRLKATRVYRHHLKATDLVVEVDEARKVSRNYKDIKNRIESSLLAENIKKNSLRAFEKIAVAESGIHGHDLEKVHFHEIGGTDAIVDIVGSFLCVDYLGIKKVYASCVPLGSGVVECSHGILPVPVPATLAILENIPVRPSDATTEIVTPTGAAIITTLAESFGAMPEMRIKKTGYGAGKRKTGSMLPNLLRIVLGEAMEENKTDDGAICKETIHVIRTNIDDMSPEASGFLMELLFENQALDVCYIPAQMKKNRPGLQMEVLCREENLNHILRLIFSQSSSIGVRVNRCQRFFLFRELVEMPTSLGRLQVKKIIHPDKTIRFVPEYEVVRKTALEQKMSFREVYNRVLCDINGLDRESLKI